MEFTGPKPTGTSRQSKLVPERRQSVRLKVHSPAYASLEGSSQETARDLNEILDIGEHGMSIQTSSPLEVDHNLNLCLDLSETKARIRTAGQVVWSDSSGRTGIRFPKLPPQSLRQLKEWLFVNVLTAFDHAHSWMREADADASSGASKGQLLSPGTPHNESSSGAPEPSGDRGSLAEVKDMQRKVDSGTYDRGVALQMIAEQALATQIIASPSDRAIAAPPARVNASACSAIICSATPRS